MRTHGDGWWGRPCPEVALLFPLLLWCCGGESDGSDPFTVRDSAGVRVVNNTAATWNEGDEWRLGEQPLLDIGTLENDPDYEFYSVANAIQLPDGRIVVGNRGTNQIRFYDESGVHLMDAGGDGEGPGEFRLISWVRRYRGDSIAVNDGNLARVSIFDSDGRFVRSIPVRAIDGAGMARAVDVLDDGSVLARGIAAVPGDADQQTIRPVEPLYVVNAEGEFKDSLFAYPGAEMYAFHSSNLVFTGPPLFARSIKYAVNGNRVYVASNDEYEVRVHTTDGTLESIVRKQHVPIEVTDADVAVLREEQLGGDAPEQMRVLLTVVFNSSPVPATMPAYDAILVDVMGNLWVEEYKRPADMVSRWTVFNAEAEMLGTLSLPDRFALSEVGDDYVLGVWRDELGIEHVRVYELAK
ncbi:MAG: hypothetical protein P8X82_12185 [Gemmatimonadales bacterium]